MTSWPDQRLVWGVVFGSGFPSSGCRADGGSLHAGGVTTTTMMMMMA
jgi:hypothetical protein